MSDRNRCSNCEELVYKDRTIPLAYRQISSTMGSIDKEFVEARDPYCMWHRKFVLLTETCAEWREDS